MSWNRTIAALLCVLLVGQQAQAVINKASNSSPTKEEESKPSENKAEDRISNSYGPPANDYGPPNGLGISTGHPAPIYGPPELTGDHGPPHIYPPPPSDQLPAIGLPGPVYGPPRNIKPHGPIRSYGPPKLNFGPPKFHLNPPKYFGPPVSPSFGSFKPKNQYGPPLKLNGVGPPPFVAPTGLPKPAHGPPIPVALETFAVPQHKPVFQFHQGPQDEYGVPPRPPTVLHGHGDLYGPPPLAPPPGVPAPPTPPDIKYDGWQPIAGLAVQHGHGHSDSYGRLNLHADIPDSVPENANLPSDSYGVPIHNQEAQDLKTSVRESSQSDQKGLPPPPLPQYEPLHNEQTPPKKDHPPKFNPDAPAPQYGPPSVEQLSIVNSVGFEILPHPAPLTSNGVQEVQNHLTVPSGEQHRDTPGPQGYPASGGHDVSLQISVPGPSNNYGPPLPPASFGKANVALAFNPGPPGDTYSAPPLSSYSPNGPYPPAGRAFPSFGFHGGSFHKHGSHRHHGFRPSGPPPGALIPPRNRDPIKFRDSIPPGLLTNINHYLPPKGPKPFGPQPPSHFTPPSLHQPPFSGSPHGGPHGRHNFNTAIAAPHAQYGTPLSFVDFNTPAPGLTYGAPNFGPPASFGSTTTGFGKNLYNNVGNTLTYGTPVVNGQGGGRDCDYPHPPSGLYSTQEGQSPALPGPPVSSGGPPALIVALQSPGNVPAPPAHPGPPALPPNHAPEPLIPSQPEVNQPPGPTHEQLIAALPAGIQPAGPPTTVEFHLQNQAALPPPPPPPPPSVDPQPPSPNQPIFFNTLALNQPTGPAQEPGFPQQQPQHFSLAEPNSPSPSGPNALLITPLQTEGGQGPTHEALVNPPSDGLVPPQDQGPSGLPGLQQQNFLQDQPLLSLQGPSSHPGSPAVDQLLFTPAPNQDLPPSQPTTAQINQGELFKVAVQAVSNTLGGVPVAPHVNRLDLQNVNDQQKTDLKDSYGNPIGINFANNDGSNNEIQGGLLIPPSGTITPPPSQIQNIFTPEGQFLQPSGVSAEALNAGLIMQGFAQPKSLGPNELDASQFLTSNEGSRALSLAQGLTPLGPDGFQIQGSKGTYMLQIQAADGGLGTENSDGSIRHDQVLSNGLLQNILAAIEQPDQNRVQESLHGVLGNIQKPVVGFVPAEHFLKSSGEKKDFGVNDRNDGSDAEAINKGLIPLNSGQVALFFNNQFGDAIKEQRSVSKSESQGSKSADNKTKTS